MTSGNILSSTTANRLDSASLRQLYISLHELLADEKNKVNVMGKKRDGYVCPECRFLVSRYSLTCRHCKRETRFSKMLHIFLYTLAGVMLAFLAALALALES